MRIFLPYPGHTAVVLLALFATSALASAQSLFYVYDADTSRFPLVTARFIALDDALTPIPAPRSDQFLVHEGAASLPVVATYCPDLTAVPLSCVLTIDVSTSMSEMVNGETNMDVARAAARTWINTMPMENAECAVTSFDDNSYLNIDFTNDRNALTNALGMLTPQGGTSYHAGFLSQPAGSLLVAKNGRNKRIIVFLTDGQAGGDEDAIVEEAIRNRVTIYCVTLRTETPRILQNVATRTGGKWFSNASSRKDLERIYRLILHLAQFDDACRITWMSEPGCNPIRNADVTFLPDSSSSILTYTAPERSLPRLKTPERHVAFGGVPPGTARDTAITLTVDHTPLKITGVSSSNPDFTVDPTIIGNMVEAGELKKIPIRYTPTDSLLGFARIEITTEPPLCDESFIYTSGGFATRREPRRAMVVRPNGGETFIAGGTATMEWSGVRPEDTVKLEYSLDNGTTWQTIAEKAHGLRHQWSLPQSASERCLARVNGPNEGSSVQVLRGGVGPITSAIFNPDGVRLIMTGLNAGGEIWDGTHGRLLKRGLDRMSPIRVLALDPTGARIATAGKDEGMKIWDEHGDLVLATLGQHPKQVTAAGFSANGERLVTGDAAGWMKVWDARMGTSVSTFPPRSGANPVRAAIFTPDGKQIAALTAKARVDLLNASTGAQIATIVATGKPGVEYTSIACSPNGMYIVTGATDSTARLWVAATGTPVRTFKGHKGTVLSVAFSPDGRWLITGSSDGTAKIWNAETGAAVRTLPGHNGDVTTVSFNPYNGRILTGSSDGAVRIWGADHSTLAPDISDSLWAIIIPRLEVVTSRIDFGKVLIGAHRDTVSMVVRNNGTRPVEIASIAREGDAQGLFSIITGDKGFSLPPGESHTMTFRFAPTTLGSASARIEFLDGNTPLAVTELVGEGVPEPMAMIAAAASIIYPSISCHETFTDAVLEIRNPGAAPLKVSSAGITGDNAPDFSIFPMFSPLTIAPGETGKLVVRFKPSDQGLRRATLHLESNAENARILPIDLEGRKDNVAFATPPGIIDLGTLCPNEEGEATVAIRNIGSIGARVHGAVSGPFQLDGSSWHVASNEEHPVTLRFPAGSGEGEFNGILELADSICGNTLSIPIRARVAEARVEAEPILFTTYDGIPVEKKMIVTNPSSREVELTGAVASDGRFTVVAPALPATIPAGESLEITLRYTPTGTEPLAGRLMLEGSPCGLSVPVSLSGNNIPSFTVGIPDFEGSAGDRIEIPLLLTGTGHSTFALGSARRFRATIRFNASLLIPGPGMPVGTVDDEGERSITIDGEWEGRSPILSHLSFTAALGDSEATPIVIERFLWTDNGSTALTSNGLFRLLDLCRQDGIRLITTGPAAALKESYPNPASSTATLTFTTVEEGSTRLILLDQLGRTVTTIAGGNFTPGPHIARFDVSDLPSGTYFYLLETPSERVRGRMEVRH